MEKRGLGNTDLEVSAVGLGCMDSAASKIKVEVPGTQSIWSG